MALIEVTDLAKTYVNEGVETPALRRASFRIESGEFVAVMGPSGSGKSTLLHILGFLERQTAGVYRFDGKTIDDFSDEELAQVRNKSVGFVFQSFNLLPRTTVLENILLPLQYSSVPRRERLALAQSAVASVQLEHRMHHASSQLSGGERQRVAIARALVNHPRVIFADEPTGNLDSKSGKVIMEILQRLNETDKHTIILITHETETADHAERVLKMRDGMLESDVRVTKRLRASQDFAK